MAWLRCVLRIEGLLRCAIHVVSKTLQFMRNAREVVLALSVSPLSLVYVSWSSRSLRICRVSSSAGVWLEPAAFRSEILHVPF